MSDYKQTLNLPKTKFPMKANLANREPNTLVLWQELDIYNTLRQERKGQEKFILHDGPPYANGHIHIGHALNKILKDIIIKSKTLSGYDAPYIPGWDCHGLPIELNVEKKLGKAGVHVSAKDFRQKCREYAGAQIDIQREEFKRLGIIGDWNNPYVTMDFKYEANIIRALGKVVENDLLKPGFKPVHWCMNCASALAEAEVEYKDKHSPAIYVRFNVLDEASILDRLHHSPDGFGEGRISVPIWTTTPWTLPANQAVCLNARLEYALVQLKIDGQQERMLIAQALIEDVMSHLDIADYRVIAYGQGETLEGLKLQHPFYDREVPILMGDHVTTEAGTGNVHTAPAHGPDDYVVCMKYDIPIIHPVNGKGVFKEDTEFFAGLHVLKANDAILEVIKSKANLLHADAIDHSYPHCWRHKTPVIFRATPQWFIHLDQAHLRKDAMESIYKVDWIPDWGQARIAGMIANRPDWCISRQRSWGAPITLFVHKDSHELHPKTPAFIEEIATRVEKDGIDAWFDLDPVELLKEEADDYFKVTDTLDVWFDSGVTHQCVLKQRDELQFPADLYLEGSDQHRGWFQSSLLTAVAIDGQAPFKQVLTHGFTVDATGRKMSKSVGNVVAPDKVIKSLGADVLRLWVAATDYRTELNISDEILKRMSDSYRRIRNTSRFLLSNLFDFDPNINALDVEDMLALDRWVVQQTQLLQRELVDAYDSYQFHLIYQKIHNFCAMTLGSFYLDIIKDRQYTCKTDSNARRSCQTAMYHIIEALVRWLAPVLSFTSEEIWQNLPGEREGSVLLTTWYDNFPEIAEESAFDNAFWDQMLKVRDEVNKQLELARNAGVIGSALATNVVLYADENLQTQLKHLGDELRFVLITSSVEIKPASEHQGNAAETELEGLWVHIEPTDHEKCQRCWHRLEEVGQHSTHPELCGRCIDNIDGVGEQRLFA